LIVVFGETLSRVEFPVAIELHSDKSNILATRIESIRPAARGFVIARLSDLVDREQYRDWRGAVVMMEETDLPPLESDEVREYELLGSKLTDASGRKLGQITEVTYTAADVVLSVQTVEGGKVLLPFNLQIIESFERVKGVLVLRLAEGFDLKKLSE